MTLSLTDMIERRDKAAAEVAIYNRMIEREALRLEKEAAQQIASDWTTTYKGKNGQILSAIWHAPRHRIETTSLCKVVWGRPAVPNPTLWGALLRVKKELKKNKCPFLLKSIKSGKTGEVKGYGLRKATMQK